MSERKFALHGIWTHVSLHTSRVWYPLHHQDNHAGNMAIKDEIYVVWNMVSREIFFQGDKAGEPKLCFKLYLLYIIIIIIIIITIIIIIILIMQMK